MVKKYRYIIVFLMFWGSINAQDYTPFYWLENSVTYSLQQEITSKPEFRFHSGILPFVKPDSVVLNSTDSVSVFNASRKFEKNGNSISIYPLVNLIGGVEVDRTEGIIGQVGAGLAITANLGKKWEFYGSGYFETVKEKSYTTEFIENNGVVHGMGKAHSGLLDYYYSRFDGYVRFRPASVFYMELGLGKQFIGEGYRSLLWSDFSGPAPYLNLNLNVWHVNYSATFSSLNDLAFSEGGDWVNAGKYTARHYLSWNISKTVQVGFFETVVWQASDSTHNRGFDVNYLNPIIFYRPVEYSIGSADNSLMGLNFKVDLDNKWTIYTQFMLDEFLLSEIRAQNGWWANKFAWQLGVKLNTEKSFYRAEFNLARPFTYSHGSVKQNYGHNHQALAHPLGANFYEGIVEARFKVGTRSSVTNILIYYLKGEDPEGVNLGGDIFTSYRNPAKTYDNYIGQGNQRIVWFYKGQFNYLLSKENNMNLLAGVQLRAENYLDQNSFSTVIYFGISTQIWNRYSEF